MKRGLALFFLFVFLSVEAGAVESVTAKEWFKLSRQRKIYFVLGSMEDYQEKRVLFRHTMDDYIGWLDGTSPNVKPDTPMSEVFASVVAVKEKAPR